ncbi:hypothetical protein [Vibrio splendidus]|uniref:hypothetical protein n=1 Tax=Vibrio splendidus TaxID=29497 RepID=UPI0007F974AF|nr:hypothetical protein [Vibrio splendidus]OBT30809.1 hypothetical protein A9262_10240 [Vibrio splendidus]
MIKLVWLLVRFAIVCLLLGVIIGVLILTNSSTPRFFSLEVDVIVCISIFWCVVAYVLVRFETTKEAGKFLFVSILGALVLLMYIKEHFWFQDMRIHSWTAFLTAIFAISLLFFVLPYRHLKPLLFLLPVSACSWFLVWVGYRPASLVIAILGAKGKLPEENINKVIELMPEIFLSCLTSGVFMVFLIMPFYIFARWGHDPKGTYQSHTKRLRGIRNARHF